MAIHENVVGFTVMPEAMYIPLTVKLLIVLFASAVVDLLTPTGIALTQRHKVGNTIG